LTAAYQVLFVGLDDDAVEGGVRDRGRDRPLDLLVGRSNRWRGCVAVHADQLLG